MSIIVLVASGPLRRTVSVRGALACRHARDLRLQIPGWLDLTYRWGRTFDLDLGLARGRPIQFTGEMPPEIGRRIEPGGKPVSDSFRVIELTAAEGERLAQSIAKATQNAAEPGVPIIDAYAPRNGVFVPVQLVRNRLINLAATETTIMPHPLERSAPSAFNRIKQVCDDHDKVIDELILYELARAQGFCKRIDHIRGNKPPRAKTLTEAEIDAVVKSYADEIARRNVAEIEEPLIDPLPDGTIAIIPLVGQEPEANVILLACFIAHGTPGSMRLALDIDEVLPAISREVLEGLGRKPKDQVSG